ncbi:hypothetical protein QIS74_04002 [Colletotrichum tabaci]|uniref:Uncharacterized protein n=1 Tax=Colletotrichum tabaci TaxID=1209068 RepID=A0AAV9TMD3_9PEZI
MPVFFDIFKDIFGDNTEFQDVGGWAKTGDVVRNSMVLVTMLPTAHALETRATPTTFVNYRERKAKVFNRFCNCRAMLTPK